MSVVGTEVAIEPGSCRSTGWADAEINAFALIPILTVFGDNLDTPATVLNWRSAYNDCIEFNKQVNRAGGNAKMLYPPDLGIRGMPQSGITICCTKPRGLPLAGRTYQEPVSG